MVHRSTSAPSLNRNVKRQAQMARNIEIKARIESVESMAPKAAAIANAGPIEITQDDSFFRCEAGRLKLRTFSADRGELIFYQRANQHDPKESFYLRSPTSAPATLRELLSLAYGQVGRVRKQRTVFLIGRTRLHLDKVEELGHFLELEVPLAEEELVEVGVREVEKIMQKLGIKPAQLIEGAYLDLLAIKASKLD
jgi:predicted adenylyl cyclase CyaB